MSEARFTSGVHARIDSRRSIDYEAERHERAKRARSIPPRERSRRSDAYITTAQLRAVWTLHRGGMSLAVIARELWERLGYSSWRSCHQGIRKGLYRDLRYPREQKAAVRLAVEKHGVFRGRATATPATREYWRRWRRAHGIGLRPLCAGHKTRGGAPCRNKALAESAFCGAHDPIRGCDWGSGLHAGRSTAEETSPIQESM